MDVMAFFQYLFAHEPTANLAGELVAVYATHSGSSAEPRRIGEVHR